jgi:small subunit ribosomal protein S20
MPNSPGAAKRHRQSKVRNQRNRSAKTALKTQVKKVRAAVAAGQMESAESEFKIAAKKLDQAGAKKIIHRNAASRQKSRLQHLIKKTKAV